MEPIRSGTTTERIVRTTILTVLFLGYSAFSFYDGYIRYPHQNVKTLSKTLAVPPDPLPEPDPGIDHTSLDSVTKGMSTDEVVASMGEPAVREGDTWIYFGMGGMARIKMQRGAFVVATEWVEADHSELDLMVQKVIGVITGVLGLLMLLQWIRVVTTRAELTDAGLKVNSQGGRRWGGSPLVPFESMVGLKTPEFKRKGWVEVEYKLADGREGTVSLNDYVHKAFPAIVTTICNERGFENPIIREQQDKSAAAAEQPDEPTPPPDASPPQDQNQPSS